MKKFIKKNLFKLAILLILIVSIYIYSFNKTNFKLGYFIKDTVANKFEAAGTFVIQDKEYNNDSNRIQLSTIECNFVDKICLESMILNNKTSISNYIYKYKIEEIDEFGFRARSETNTSELLYNKRIKTLTKNYQLDGKIFPMKLE
jgi:hypothetical protein